MFYGLISNFYFTCREEKELGARVMIRIEFKAQGDQGEKSEFLQPSRKERFSEV